MNNKRKSYMLRKILPACILLILVFAGLIKIDIINTKSLSPLGNTNQNYELVNEEFGEDFSNFIKDNSWIKIYKEKGDDVLIRIGDRDLKITNSSVFTKSTKGVYDKIKNVFLKAKETFYDFGNKLLFSAYF